MQIYLHICSADNLYRQICKKALSVVLYKGDNHTVTNNVAWDDSDQSDCTICVPTELQDNPMNVNTVLVNNGAQKFQGRIDYTGWSN